MLKTRVLPFEYEVLKKLKTLNVDWSTQRLLVASSAGRDSVVLLNTLSTLNVRLKFSKFAVAHVHHGESADKKISTYRRKAATFAKKSAKENGAEFYLLKHLGKTLASEADFRKVREALLAKCRAEESFDWVVYAHHADDLLETRLIRLIRGTGSQGLQAMSFAHQKKLRPLLEKSANQISDYALNQKLLWIEDPTNCEDEYFRNWLRNSWLPLLEQKRAGSRQSLARSLETITEQVTEAVSQKSQQPRLDVIKRKEFATLNRVEQREVLARVMLERGARDFSRRQIDEILKRLSSHQGVNRRKLEFEVGGLQWRVNAEQIEAVRL